MGQGTESCGGYEIPEDPYEDGLDTGVWTMKNHGSIRVEDMGYQHLKRAMALCRRLSETATFSCEADKWDAWITIFENELAKGPRGVPKPKPAEAKKPTRGKAVDLICFCGTQYRARVADLKRGWGQACCRSCAAIKRDYGRPDPRIRGEHRSFKELLAHLRSQ